MRSAELRHKFIEFFKQREHTIVPSAPLVPKEDPSLLFTSAGMVQFKSFYAGTEPLPYRRAASIQKCLRTSDLEHVGKTIRHNTFFEMLGNFSFGDYFKKEAIQWAWEFLTDVLNIPEERLYASVLEDDDEAYNIWKNVIKLPSNKIVRLDKEENFWGPAGTSGACGPCSEIHIDLGESRGCGKPGCSVGCDCERFLEFWNLVFPQYNQDEQGRLLPLQNRGIDTGLGLERLAMIMQDVDTLFETDLLYPIVNKTAEISKIQYHQDSQKDVSLHIIADHVRALTFALADGIFPSNEGRGYVLRRLLRRAVRHGWLLDMKEPFLYKLVSIVIDLMGDEYPELVERTQQIAMITKSEEERFFITLEQGMNIFAEIVEKLKKENKSQIDGELAFRLYDTYGFPLDLIKEIANETQLTVDEHSFNHALEMQRQRARVASKFEESEIAISTSSSAEWTAITHGEHSRFIGHDICEANVQIRQFIEKSPQQLQLILDITPFYGEAGGQVGDTGRIFNQTTEIEIENTIISQQSIIHIGKIKKGKIEPTTYTAQVDTIRRAAIARNHTATHLLHAVLRNMFGSHVQQQGSLVVPDRLRFDFTHYSAISTRELKIIEQLVNQKIIANLRVNTFITTFEKARQRGAIALFGEKYGDEVRAVQIGDFSLELCGGTHVKSTGEIGIFKLINESSIAAGIRRIEALTGEEAYRYIDTNESLLQECAELLKCSTSELSSKVERLIQSQKELERKLEHLQEKLAISVITELCTKPCTIENIRVVSAKVDAPSVESLRNMADILRERIKSGVGVLGTIINQKATFVAIVTDDIISQRAIKAGDIVREVAKLTGGSGGGKPHLAQAGAKDITKFEYVIEQVPEIVKRLVSV